jgi:NAD-dependent SIR2 family protein deacetylase
LSDFDALRSFLDAHPRLCIVTGAGISTESGIPDYRDADGGWKRSPPVQFNLFMEARAVRQRYWARSLVGWRYFGAARPNEAHRALARLERQGRVDLLVTQDVDRLHSEAGSERVVDLHGRLDASAAPDGDVDLASRDFSDVEVPECQVCGGILKADVVFHGERARRGSSARAEGLDIVLRSAWGGSRGARLTSL